MSNSERDPLLEALEGESGESEALAAAAPVDLEREKALEDFKKRLKDHREWDAKLRDLRLGIKGLDKDYEKTEDVSNIRGFVLYSKTNQLNRTSKHFKV